MRVLASVVAFLLVLVLAAAVQVNKSERNRHDMYRRKLKLYQLFLSRIDDHG
jgi:CHASE1-domain containing sensor protein